MKKILIALLVVTMASSAMIAGCSNKSDDKNTSSDNSIISEESSKSLNSSESSTENSSSNSDSDSSKPESISSDSNKATDEDFVWEDGKYITDLSEEGAKKKEIVIPKKCQMFMMSDFQSGNFGDNDNLESIIFESDDIKDLPSGCFINDINLKKVKLPEKLKKISENLFSGCKSLESIEIPSSVTEIEDQAFEDTAIKELKIPESVTSVGETVFRYTKIEKLYLPESLTTISSSFLGDLDDTDTSYKLTVYVKKGSYADEHFEEYQFSSVTKEYY